MSGTRDVRLRRSASAISAFGDGMMLAALPPLALSISGSVWARGGARCRGRGLVDAVRFAVPIAGRRRRLGTLNLRLVAAGAFPVDAGEAALRCRVERIHDERLGVRAGRSGRRSPRTMVCGPWLSPAFAVGGPRGAASRGGNRVVTRPDESGRDGGVSVSRKPGEHAISPAMPSPAETTLTDF